MRINWTEVSKFLSGAFFAGGIANAYFYFAQIDAPFLGYTIPYGLLGVRAVIHFVLFAVCFYFGFLRKTRQ